VLARRADGLPETRVRRLRLTAAAEVAAQVCRVPAASIYDVFDRRYGEFAAQEARRLRSDLFMYSSYAHEAFTAQFLHTPRKILFQYHPHYEIERSILESDRKASKKLDIVFRGKPDNLIASQRGSRKCGDAAWQIADHIICASGFTKDSLVEVGADPAKITVVPYGVDFESAQASDETCQLDEGFHALFVGSGLQRKGLHHLMLAWRSARLPTGARLTVVARVVDPGLIPLLQTTRGVHYRRGVAAPELRRLYRTATVFVMPSLVEGFGQVYLEALARGLPVVGTRNTCLADIGGEEHGIFLTTPGNIDELVALLELLAVQLDNNTTIRQSAARRARQYTWPKFRSSMRELI